MDIAMVVIKVMAMCQYNDLAVPIDIFIGKFPARLCSTIEQII